MQKKVLTPALFAVLWLLSMLVTPAQARENQVWKNDEFVKTVEAIKKQNWNEISTRDVAMLQFAEIGRLAESMESRLTSQADRFYKLTLIGGVVVGIYLILQLLLTLVLVVRVGRLVEQKKYSYGRP